MKEHSPTQFMKRALLYPEPDKDNFERKKKKREKKNITGQCTSQIEM